MLENWENSSFSTMRYYTKNESGEFCCDEIGRLTRLDPEIKNCLNQSPFGLTRFQGKKNVKNLVLPDGIREIAYDAENLCNLIVVEKLVLPSSLEKLDKGVLSGCLIMEMELPVALREIGAGALMKNYIHLLRIPQGMLHPWLPGYTEKPDVVLAIHGRQFKETIINTLIVPREYPYENLLREAIINNIVYSD